MPDVAIVNSTIAAEPKDYTLTGSQELLLKSVRASIDGSGAASAFLPTLQLLAPDGTVMWEAPTSSTVAAGGSADVSWFPSVGQTRAATAAGGWTLATAYSNAIVNVASGATAILDMSTGSLYTNDSGVFAIGTQVISAVTYHGLKVLADGHYLGKGQVQIGGLSSANTGYVAVLWQNEPGSPASYGSAGAVLNCPTTVAQGQWNPYVESLSTVNGGSADLWLIQVHNTTNVTVTASLDMMSVQLDTDTTHIF